MESFATPRRRGGSALCCAQPLDLIIVCNPLQSSFHKQMPTANGHQRPPSSQQRTPGGCATELLALLRSARFPSYLPKAGRVAHGPECLLGAANAFGHSCRTQLLRCGFSHRQSVHTPLLLVNSIFCRPSVEQRATVACYDLSDVFLAVTNAAHKPIAHQHKIQSRIRFNR